MGATALASATQVGMMGVECPASQRVAFAAAQLDRTQLDNAAPAGQESAPASALASASEALMRAGRTPLTRSVSAMSWLIENARHALRRSRWHHAERRAREKEGESLGTGVGTWSGPHPRTAPTGYSGIDASLLAHLTG